MTLPPIGQAVENPYSLTREPLSKSLSSGVNRSWDVVRFSLHALNGERKYLNQNEFQRALRAMRRLSPVRSLYARVLAFTGARPSEILNLTANSIDIEGGVVNIITLKRRGELVVRGVPIPPGLMAALVLHFDLRRLQRDPVTATQQLFAWSYSTAWRIIKRVMAWAEISGVKACQKGFRHAFGVLMLQAKVPETILQRWMGHARLSTTAIYLNVCGPEEISFAERFWNTMPEAA